MSLFKTFRGIRASLDTQPKHDGYAYFCTDDGTFHIDYVDGNGDLQRKQINESQINNISTQINDLINRISTLEEQSTDMIIETITLYATNWTGDTSPYSQVISIDGVAETSKIDLQPTPEQIAELQDNEITLTAVNDNGTVTVYALNYKPEKDYEIQITMTDVTESAANLPSAEGVSF